VSATPEGNAGEITEAIMGIFWLSKEPPVKLEASQYNAIYSHVYDTLVAAGVDDSMPRSYYDYLCDGCKKRVSKAIVLDAKKAGVL